LIRDLRRKFPYTIKTPGFKGDVIREIGLGRTSCPEVDTDKALAGLFCLVGQEEIKIRKDPAARVTDLLKSVFGG
jgi:Protein of unknown function (DUF4197)